MTISTKSQTFDLGNHVLEVTEHYTLIASYPNADDPISEVVQLTDEEAYKLLVALQARFQQGVPLGIGEQRQNQEAWEDYHAPHNLALQCPDQDRMNCTMCGEEHTVRYLSEAGRCLRCALTPSL